jgi:hypothetical protein
MLIGALVGVACAVAVGSRTGGRPPDDRDRDGVGARDADAARPEPSDVESAGRDEGIDP